MGSSKTLGVQESAEFIVGRVQDSGKSQIVESSR